MGPTYADTLQLEVLVVIAKPIATMQVSLLPLTHNALHHILFFLSSHMTMVRCGNTNSRSTGPVAELENL